MDRLEQLAAATQESFEAIHRDSFLGDPGCNPKLKVEVLHAAMVGATPTLILITPWTLNGLLFPDKAIAELVVGRRRFPVFEATVEGIGTYSSVNLVPDVSGLADREAARHAAAALVAPFRQAVARALEEQTVSDPNRRDLFKRLSGDDS